MLKYKTKISIILIVALVIALFAGCGTPETAPDDAPTTAPDGAPATAPDDTPAATSPTTQDNAEETPGRIAFITGTGGLGDRNLNDFTFAGAQWHEANGVIVDVVQPSDIADIPNLFRLYAEAGHYDLIIGIAIDSREALAEIAPQFPEQSFAIADVQVDLPNVTSVVFRAEETGFQLGVIGSLLAKDSILPNTRDQNTIGFVGGMDIVVINRFLAGYLAGAKLVNPDVTVLSSFVGSFRDPTTATELAITMYEQGADVIFACAGGSGLGVFTAADSENGYVFGVETNQNVLYPNNVIASGTRDWGSAIYEVIAQAIAGKLQGGLVEFGIADGALMPEREGSDVAVPDEIIQIMEDLSAQVGNGTIVLPITPDDVDAFLATHTWQG